MCVCREIEQEGETLLLQIPHEIQPFGGELGLNSYACDGFVKHLSVLYIRYVEICDLMILYEMGFNQSTNSCEIGVTMG
ncbi:hypothetical protein Hanom_Chr10g00921011 [Helianthus anomalus]